jgi:hypothetical protein
LGWIVERNFTKNLGELLNQSLKVRRWSGLQLLGEVTLEGSNANNNANPEAKDEGSAFLEGDSGLDDDLGHRVRQWIYDEIPYLAHLLLMFRLGNLPRWLPEVDDCGGARQNQELEDETRGTQLDKLGLQCV